MCVCVCVTGKACFERNLRVTIFKKFLFKRLVVNSQVCVQLLAPSWTVAHQGSLFFTVSQN